MKRILTLDARNYPADMAEIKRVAVRAVIFMDGKLLMIEDAHGQVKLPGGGVEGMEDEHQALAREVKEETGYAVIPKTIRPFGEIVEKRLSAYEPMIWHQISHLYFCDVYPEQSACEYTENEKQHGFRQVLYTLDEALEKNETMLNTEDRQAWNQREYRTLLLLKKHLSGAEIPSGGEERVACS